MSPCLVQQLFRQKIGQEVDQDLIDEILFPLLFRKKCLPYSLHLDICMIQNITVYARIHYNNPQRLTLKNVPPLTKKSERWKDVRSYEFLHGREGGRNGRTFHRKRVYGRRWGSVDILNELRDLKHPRMGYHSTVDPTEEHFDDFSRIISGTEFVNAYLRLEEDEMIPGTSDWCIEREKSRMMRYKFVNGFLDYLIETGKRASWGGMSVNPEFTFEPILSN